LGIDLAHLFLETSDMRFESLELDSGNLVTFVTVMRTNGGVVGVVVPEDLFVLFRRVILKPVVVSTRFSGTFDREQPDSGPFLRIDLQVPIKHNVAVSHVAVP
jgi:hypothetical protein